jgi:hypothetical protein
MIPLEIILHDLKNFTFFFCMFKECDVNELEINTKENGEAT